MVDFSLPAFPNLKRKYKKLEKKIRNGDAEKTALQDALLGKVYILSVPLADLHCAHDDTGLHANAGRAFK